MANNMTPEDKGEYDYEGDMAKSQLRSILVNANRLHDMLGEDTNLPEWVQSKITLATDYIQTAASYMESEMNEEMKPYVKAAQAKFDAQTKAQQMGKKQAGTLAARKERLKDKQASAAQKAIDIVRGQKNKINKTPEVNTDVKVQ
jgi:phage anti-repressor protein